MDKKITIKMLKAVIASKRWNPYYGGPMDERIAKEMEQRKWLVSALKILENEVGIDQDEFRCRFGMVGIEAMGPNLS